MSGLPEWRSELGWNGWRTSPLCPRALRNEECGGLASVAVECGGLGIGGRGRCMRLMRWDSSHRGGAVCTERSDVSH